MFQLVPTGYVRFCYERRDVYSVSRISRAYCWCSWKLLERLHDFGLCHNFVTSSDVCITFWRFQHWNVSEIPITCWKGGCTYKQNRPPFPAVSNYRNLIGTWWSVLECIRKIRNRFPARWKLLQTAGKRGLFCLYVHPPFQHVMGISDTFQCWKRQNVMQTSELVTKLWHSPKSCNLSNNFQEHQQYARDMRDTLYTSRRS